MKPLRIVEPAELEYQEALRWYRDRDVRVAERFAHETRRTLARIEAFPQIGGRVPDVEDQEVRQMPIRTFPYQVVFVHLPDRLEVVAFAHYRRRPAYFLDRLSNEDGERQASHVRRRGVPGRSFAFACATSVIPAT